MRAQNANDAYNNFLKLYLDVISYLVNFSCELGPIMARYDLL